MTIETALFQAEAVAHLQGFEAEILPLVEFTKILLKREEILLNLSKDVKSLCLPESVLADKISHAEAELDKLTVPTRIR